VLAAAEGDSWLWVNRTYLTDFLDFCLTTPEGEWVGGTVTRTDRAR
jgi:hypothetical protein